MPKKQSGFAHVLVLVLLLAGLVGSVYLVQNKTNLFSKATEGTDANVLIKDGFENGISSWQIVSPTTPTTDISVKDNFGHNSSKSLRLNLQANNTLSI
ncbi:MAG: hypothetical protein V1808_04030, partial [Candidatus Daviesbacteria bacterium]